MVMVAVMMSVLIVLVMMMLVFMGVFMLVMVVLVGVRYAARMCMLMTVFVREMNIKFNSFDGGFMTTRDVQVVTMKIQLFQFVLQVVRVDTEIEQCADKHIAADSAEDVQI